MKKPSIYRAPDGSQYQVIQWETSQPIPEDWKIFDGKSDYVGMISICKKIKNKKTR